MTTGSRHASPPDEEAGEPVAIAEAIGRDGEGLLGGADEVAVPLQLANNADIAKKMTRFIR